MSKFRVGLIGCGGRMTGAHMKAFERMDDVQVVAIAEPVEERRLATQARYGLDDSRCYKDHNEFYAHENKETLDAIFIAIEPCAHDRNTELPAVEMGIPFLIEKPMSMDMDLAKEIADKVEAKGLITAVGFQDRYLDLMDIIKEEVPKHKAGGLVWGAWIGGIPGVWWWQKKSTCGGQLLEQNIHILDNLRWLYGEPKTLYATATTGMIKAGVDAKPEYDTDDHSTVVMTFENGVTATLVSGCYIQGRFDTKLSGLTISMNDMTIEYHLRNNVILKTAKETHNFYRQEDQTYTLDRAFVDAVKTNNPALVRSPYQDAYKSLKLCDDANKSMETGEVFKY